MKIRTKDAAEAALRELPSVLGVRVREDVYGHPREVHVLVKSGPNVRNLALDIRELLEERLGIPVDQRVISIAQLAPGASFDLDDGAEAPRDGADAGGLTSAADGVAALAAGVESETGTEPETSQPEVGVALAEPVEVAQSPATAVEAPVSARPVAPRVALPSSPPALQQAGYEGVRLYFVGRSTVQRDGRVTVAVRVALGDQEFSGEATDLDSSIGRARAAALAALGAVAAVVGGEAGFYLEGATLCRTLDRDYVLVSALGSIPRRGRAPMLLAGVQEVEADVETAAALAALKATNRIVENLVLQA